MTKSLHELHERLLRAGVAPRHVRRYLAELNDHLADLTAEEERAGRSRADAESAALTRLGGIDDLVRAMTSQRQLQSWAFRAPWAAFGLAPAFSLAVVWFIALSGLWSGWRIFLPGSDTPFVPAGGFANLYFQADRALYFGAPILVGWGIGLIAVRQRLNALWPIAGLILVALIGGTSQVQASRTGVPGGIGHISMNFTLGSTDPLLPYGLLHALVILFLMVLPYLLWRLQKALSVTD